MKQIHPTKRVLSTVLAAVAILALLPAATAAAAPWDCDRSSAPFGVYRAVQSGASFFHQGREINLLNESINDVWSYARIQQPINSGEQVWIDRSWNQMPSSVPRYPSSDQVNANGGWKQCGPFTANASGAVYSWHYAVRACYRPPGGPSVCGRWYIDR